ncbi:MAG: lipase family protein [Pseudonocardiaceae bacterium]
MPVTTNIDPSIASLLIDASIESYYALDPHAPAKCNLRNVTPPTGYDLVDCWTGIDTVFSIFNQVECFGVVFRSQAAPYTYIFSFRGTYSMLDVLEDLDFWEQDDFVPFQAPSPPEAKVSRGFWSIYNTAESGTQSMQKQLFGLLDKYHASAQPIHRLLVTGHSLGAALCELFTLDLALSGYRDIAYSNYNYAGPAVGNPAFAELYDSQPREKDPATQTLRIQNTYDRVPCSPPDIPLFPVYQHVGAAYLIAFYNTDWATPYALLYNHQALNYQAVLTCAFASKGGVCINDKLFVPSDNETLVSLQPDPSTLCSLLLQAQTPGIPAAVSPGRPGSDGSAVAPSPGP